MLVRKPPWAPTSRAIYFAEAAIRRCGVPYTIFKAHFFMESLLRFIRGPFALQIGRHPHPYPWIAADDYAQMVSRSFSFPEAAGKELFVYGPQVLSMRQVLQTYCRIVRPDLRLVYFPLWAAWIIARLGRRRELQAALPFFFRYIEKVHVGGDPAEANALLGAPTTYLSEVRTDLASYARPWKPGVNRWSGDRQLLSFPQQADYAKPDGLHHCFNGPQ